MTNQENRYWAFMVRLYRVDDSEQSDWRSSVENPHTGERFGFGTLEEFFDFLKSFTQFYGPNGILSSPHKQSDQSEREP